MCVCVCASMYDYHIAVAIGPLAPLKGDGCVVESAKATIYREHTPPHSKRGKVLRKY